MKIIKQTKLFFHEGKSDKVYEIDLCEINPDAFIVNFRYGRRGAALKEGSKTPEFVSREKAESIFDQLEKEKRNKGYQSEVEVFVELPSLETVNMNSSKGVILKRLEDATQGINSFKTEWKTSRVIWKAAQMELKESVPYILKLATKGDEMQLYASIFAIRTLKITQASGLLHSIAHSTRHKQYIRNVAFDALLKINEASEQEKTVSELLENLPAEIRYAIDKGDYQSLKKHYTEKFDKKKKQMSLCTFIFCRKRILLWLRLLKPLSGRFRLNRLISEISGQYISSPASEMMRRFLDYFHFYSKRKNRCSTELPVLIKNHGIRSSTFIISVAM